MFDDHDPRLEISAIDYGLIAFIISMGLCLVGWALALWVM